MGSVAVWTLRVVLVVMFAGMVLVQAGMVWVLLSGSDPEDGSLPLTAFRVLVVAGMVALEVIVLCVLRLLSMVRHGTVFSPAAFRYVDGTITAILVAGLLWCTGTAINAPGQRDDPGVIVIMGGVGLAIFGVALIVYVLRMLLSQAVAREREASRMRSELETVI